MFKIEDGIIYITRGDDAVFDIAAKYGEDEEPYTLQAGDYYTFTVRKAPSRDSAIVFSTISVNGRIIILHGDTAEAEVGKYSADIQLNTSDGKRLTIWPQLSGSNRYTESNFKNFWIMPEVTDV